MPTYLDDHWFSGPAVTGEGDRVPAPPGTPVRFGPGVPRTAPPAPSPAAAGGSPASGGGRTASAGGTRGRAGGRRRVRGCWPVAVVLALVSGFLVWQGMDPRIVVEDVFVDTAADRIGCGGTAGITGTVTTNGGSGSLVYRWLRSDGTGSGTLREEVPRGQETISVRLRWAFTGTGTRRARATLELLSPSARTASAAFTYSCR